MFETTTEGLLVAPKKNHLNPLDHKTMKHEGFTPQNMGYNL